MANHSENPLVIEPDSDSDPEEYSDAMAAQPDMPTKDENQVGNEDEFFDVDWNENKSDISEEDKEETTYENSAQDEKEQKLKERLEFEASMTEDEKSDRKSQAQELKKKGNQFYLAGENEDAINQYNQGLEICPLCFSEDRSILMANKAAAMIKMDQKVEAIEQCSEAIQLNPKYVKALLRRGQTYEETDKPHEAMKDFQQVLEIDPAHKEARMAVIRLPEKIKEKDEKLKEEMMTNLKQLGNMVLKPFGLSTNNFNMVQDPNTGGYSVQFKQ